MELTKTMRKYICSALLNGEKENDKNGRTCAVAAMLPYDMLVQLVPAFLSWILNICLVCVRLFCTQSTSLSPIAHRHTHTHAHTRILLTKQSKTKQCM